MEAQSQSLDRISGLPEDTVEKILSHMPIRDAVRTSILSRKWRYSWTNMPRLVFDNELIDALSDLEEEIDKYKFVRVIFHIMLLHKGPISELCFRFADTNIISEIIDEIDQIILHLSWSKNIKKFTFDVNHINDYYKLPRSFFSLQGLEHLSLKLCKIDLPLVFNGIRMLKSLAFDGVEITAKMLCRFLTSCPLLEEFTLIRYNPIELTECEFVELFNCLPSVQVLEISQLDIKDMTAGGMPHKLPISLPHLRILVLDVCCLELSYALSVINSSPNLEKIKIEMCWEDDGMCRKQSFNNLLNNKDYTCLNLDHLKQLEIISFRDHGLWMEFVKLIMAKSPVLKKIRIELCTSVSVEEEVKMLRDFLYSPLPRASPTCSGNLAVGYHGDIPHKLPVSLPYLRILVLGVVFFELWSVLCVISSSPNLEKIKIKICWGHDQVHRKQSFKNLVDNKDYTCLNLDHLKELEITSFRDHALWMEFVKLIMAKSPVLKKTRIELCTSVSVEEQVKMLQDFLYSPLPRASPTGKFIMERPKK
ncbi:hypothetical protein LXL04_011160 [Taraxacum kok-saghyz]